MDLESKRPSGPLFRVSRDDDAWTVPDWAYAKEDGTFGNRFDDPMGVYRVLYASSQRLGCFIETLARFRVDIAFVADLALMENGDDDFTAFGTVRKAWLKGRCIGTADVEGEYADIYALEWVSHLRTALAGVAVKLGMKDFDLSSLEPAEPRLLTQRAGRIASSSDMRASSTTLAMATLSKTGPYSRTGRCRIDFPSVSPNRREWLKTIRICSKR
jgi:hypothetical protein